jgi:hypothetical protein
LKTGIPFSDVQIFQIFYRADQQQALEPVFVPYDNSGVKDERLEFGVFESLSKSSQTRRLSLWGAVSWRFGQKTGLTGLDLLNVIEAHPEVDVFFMNSSPINEALFDSGWMQGEISHPGLIKVAQAALAVAGHDPSLVYQPEHSSVYSTANYFVGRSAFWKAYIPFVKGILDAADQKLPEGMRRRLHSNADPKRIHHGATFIPFLVERLFPLFMQTDGRHLRSHKVLLPAREAELNVHLKLLRSMKDEAIVMQSPWLIHAWRNYRNLLLQQMAAPKWCNQHLPMMNAASWQ